jgi:hypothetical protein
MTLLQTFLAKGGAALIATALIATALIATSSTCTSLHRKGKLWYMSISILYM